MSLIHIHVAYSYIFIFIYLYAHSCYFFIFRCPGSSKKIIHDKMSRIFNKNHSWIWISDFCYKWSTKLIICSKSRLFIFIYLYSYSCRLFVFMWLIHIFSYSDVPDLQKKSFMTKCPGSSIKIIHDKVSRIFNKNHSWQNVQDLQ